MITMAAECLGAPFFQYKFQDVASITPVSNDVVWVNKRYTPIDLRSTAPVQRRKFLATTRRESFGHENVIPDTWKHNTDPPSEFFSRDKEELRLLPSSHATRCEEWSTLRQMLPSRGHIRRVSSPRWGTGGPPSEMQFNRAPPTRFPHMNSPMTGVSAGRTHTDSPVYEVCPFGVTGSQTGSLSPLIGERRRLPAVLQDSVVEEIDGIRFDRGSPV